MKNENEWLDGWIYVLTIAVFFNEDLMESAKAWAKKRKAMGKSYKLNQFCLHNLMTILNHPNLEDARSQYYQERSARDTF